MVRFFSSISVDVLELMFYSIDYTMQYGRASARVCAEIVAALTPFGAVVQLTVVACDLQHIWGSTVK